MSIENFHHVRWHFDVKLQQQQHLCIIYATSCLVSNRTIQSMQRWRCSEKKMKCWSRSGRNCLILEITFNMAGWTECAGTAYTQITNFQTFFFSMQNARATEIGRMLPHVKLNFSCALPESDGPSSLDRLIPNENSFLIRCQLLVLFRCPFSKSVNANIKLK